jgi:hypothetical protein
MCWLTFPAQSPAYWPSGMDDQRQRDEEPNHADPRYRIEFSERLRAPSGVLKRGWMIRASPVTPIFALVAVSLC